MPVSKATCAVVGVVGALAGGCIVFGELQGHLDPDVDASLVDGAQTDAPVGPADDASTDATLVDVATDASVPDVVRAAGPTVCSKKGGEMTALAPRKGGLPHLYRHERGHAQCLRAVRSRGERRFPGYATGVPRRRAGAL